MSIIRIISIQYAVLKAVPNVEQPSGLMIGTYGTGGRSTASITRANRNELGVDFVNLVISGIVIVMIHVILRAVVIVFMDDTLLVSVTGFTEGSIAL